MQRNNLSLPAGTACATCNHPDPCLCKITINGFDSGTHIWPEEKKIHLDVLDDGTGSKGTIKIEGKCVSKSCPEGYLESERDKILLTNDSDSPATLYFKKSSDQATPDSNIEINPIWDYFNNIALPTDVFSEPRNYKLITQGCFQCSNYAEINVYPTVELQASVGFSYAMQGEERSWKERRDEQIAARKNMNNAKPRNKNKLRDGWKLHTDQFKITKEYKLSTEFELSICGTDYSLNLARATNKVKTFKTLEHIGKVNEFVSNIGNHLLPDESKKGESRKLLPVVVSFEPISMGIAYAYQRTESVVDTTHFIGFIAAPFLKLEVKLNIIPLIAILSRNKKVIEVCHKLIKNKNLDLYLMVEMDLNISLGATFNKGLWTFSDPDGVEFISKFDDKDGTKLGATISGGVSAAFEKEAVLLNISLKYKFEAFTKIKTTLGVALDPHDDGLDLVGYHDGIVVEVGVKSEFRSQGKRKESPVNYSKDSSIEDTIVLGAPLEADESPLRVNLFGKRRKLEERKI